METFAQRLKRLRNEQGLRGVDLAQGAAISESTIRQLERGNVKAPGLLVGIRLADALHVDVRYLAFGEIALTSERLDAHDAALRALEKRLLALERKR